MAYTLLTGGTGLIGRYLMKDLIANSKPLAVIARGADGAERIQQALLEMHQRFHDLFDVSDIANVVVIQADLLRDDLGLAAADSEWIARNVESVIHCAGDVSFHETSGDSITWDTNVNGTHRLARLCKGLGIEDFAYVSTSFVCGTRQGLILEEELNCGQAFESIYEESKFKAEELLTQFNFKRLNVFRPCSVTGDSSTGYTSTYHGIYWFAQFTSLARQRADPKVGEQWRHDVRIFKSGRELHHLIPVDYVSRAIVEIHSLADTEGATYHLTPLVPSNLAMLGKALAEYYNFYGVSFAECDPSQNLNYMEVLFYDGMKSIGHRYLSGDPRFDCSKTLQQLAWWEDVTIDHCYLLRIFEFAERERFGRGSRRPRKRLSQSPT